MLQMSPPDTVPRRRSGRPTAERVAAIDAAIRDAAEQIFFDVGFEAANMDAIAAAADVSKGTLYARYRSKEALFRAVLEDLLEKLSARAGEQDHLLPENLQALAPLLLALGSLVGYYTFVRVVERRPVTDATQSLARSALASAARS